MTRGREGSKISKYGWHHLWTALTWLLNSANIYNIRTTSSWVLLTIIYCDFLSPFIIISDNQLSLSNHSENFFLSISSRVYLLRVFNFLQTKEPNLTEQKSSRCLFSLFFHVSDSVCKYCTYCNTTYLPLHHI